MVEKKKNLEKKEVKKEVKKSKKNTIITLIISDLLIMVCECLLLYPIVSDIWNSEHSSMMIDVYNEVVEEISEKDYTDLLEEAREYNSSLVTKSENRFNMKENEREEYITKLKLPETDIMAFLSITKIGLENQPIYHSTTNAVLQVGVGHYEGSSLPVGGKSTHCVLSGHTGMASMKMFSELNTLVIGDIFQIHVLKEVLTYQVEDIRRVYPDDISCLGIEEGRDLCTLVTCIPLGINSERLLVRGTRIPTPETEKELEMLIKNDEKESFWNKLTKHFSNYELIMTGIAILIFVIFIIPDMKRYYKYYKNKKIKE